MDTILIHWDLTVPTLLFGQWEPFQLTSTLLMKNKALQLSTPWMNFKVARLTHGVV